MHRIRPQDTQASCHVYAVRRPVPRLVHGVERRLLYPDPDPDPDPEQGRKEGIEMTTNDTYVSDRRFRPAASVGEVIDWLKTHRYVWYQAPMDYSPSRVSLTSKLQLWKRSPLRFAFSVESINTWANPSLRLRIDEGHLDRIRIPFERWHHGITATLTHVRYVGRAKPAIVLNQSNGYHLEMSVRHAINFAKHKAMRLTVTRGNRTRILVPAHPPISGERNF